MLLTRSLVSSLVARLQSQYPEGYGLGSPRRWRPNAPGNRGLYQPMKCRDRISTSSTFFLVGRQPTIGRAGRARLGLNPRCFPAFLARILAPATARLPDGISPDRTARCSSCPTPASRWLDSPSPPLGPRLGPSNGARYPSHVPLRHGRRVQLLLARTGTPHTVECVVSCAALKLGLSREVEWWVAQERSPSSL